MKIKPRLTYTNSKDFIGEYIKCCGLDNIDGEVCYPPAKINVNGLEEPICIIQDSDMDGVMSAAIVYNWLKENGYIAKVLFHKGKQHGAMDLLDDIISTNGVGRYGTAIIPDAGSQDEYPIKEICKGMTDVIAIDHHEYHKWDMPCDARIINCKDWDMGNYLSGGAVCNYVLDANQMDLAACSIISDVMPLNDVYNRYVVHIGLENITNPFLKYLVDKLNKGAKPTPKWVAWTLAPLVSSVERSSNQDAKELMFRAFVNEADFDDALAIMRKCHREQKQKIDELYEQLTNNLDDSHKFVIAFADGDESNYNGLVANKILSKYNKPILVLRNLNNTQWSGSMRSPVPLLEQINESGYATCQGHSMAAGIQVSKSQLHNLLEWADNHDIDMHPAIDVACELNPSDIDLPLCQSIQEHMDLYGQGIEEPLFYSKFIVNKDHIRVFRKSSNTLRIDNWDNVSLIKFRISDEDADFLENCDMIEMEVTYRLSIDEYNGVQSCQGIIDDIEWHDVNKPNEFDWDEIFN